MLEKIKSAIKGNSSMVAFSIKEAIAKGQSESTIVWWVKEMTQDNEPAMVGILGQDLVNEIKSV